MTPGAGPSANQHPVVLALPFLPTSEVCEFDRWWLGPIERYEGPWTSAAFERCVHQFLGQFRRAGGEPLEAKTLLVDTSGPAGGRTPLPKELEALRLTVGLAVIHQNPYWSPESQSAAWSVATADNADLWAQPLDTAEGWLSLSRGSRVETRLGGLRLGDPGSSIPAPLELHLPLAVRLDAELMNAAFRVLHGAARGSVGARMAVAIRWLIKSWHNTTSLSWGDRLAFIKVATEALSGEDDSTECARWLEALFAGAAAQPGGGVGCDDLLWSYDERLMTRRWSTRQGASRQAQVTPFVHWYCSLADQRNALLHGQADIDHDYTDRSAYSGPFVEIGDRVLREAIAVQLGEQGHPEVWRRGISRASFRLWEHLENDRLDADPSGSSEVKEPP